MAFDIVIGVVQNPLFQSSLRGYGGVRYGLRELLAPRGSEEERSRAMGVSADLGRWWTMMGDDRGGTIGCGDEEEWTKRGGRRGRGTTEKPSETGRSWTLMAFSRSFGRRG
jgi:hypothetical protein